MQTQNKVKLIAIAILATILLSPINTVHASPTISIDQVGETTGALAKEADASVYFVMSWEDFSANKTVNIWCYNGTGDKELIDDTVTGYEIPVTDVNSTLLTGDSQGADGEYENTFTISGLTDEIGTYTYTMKVQDNSDNTTLATKDFTVLVAEEDIELAVSVEDSSGDGTIDKDESVVFTYYVNWVSVPSSETHQVYVQYDDGSFSNKGSVSVTAGAGSDTGTFTKVWNTEGGKTVNVELRDASGAVVASISLPLTVGGETPEQVSSTPTTATSVTTVPIWQNPIVIVALIVIAVLSTILLMKK